MNARIDPSVDELKRESERTRAALADTVCELREKVGETAEELRTRISPSHIKEEMRDSLVHSVQRRIRDNPLQTAAIGAALAYPAWSVLRLLPPPLLLIGAGIWLAGSQGRRSIHRLETRLSDTAAQANARVSELAGSIERDAAALSTDAQATVTSATAAVTDKLRASVHDARDAVTHKAATVIEAGVSRARAASDAASRSATALQDRATRTAARSLERSKEMIDQNPLLVAGIGLAVGAFIATLLPKSGVEDRLIGPVADTLRSKAREAAAQGLDRAKEMASGVIDDVAAAASTEGIDAAGVKTAVASAVENVGAVVERGVQTALSSAAPAHHNPSSSQT